MVKFLTIVLQAIVEVLRKLWQRLTGRVPVPVRVRRFSLDGVGAGFSYSSSSLLPFEPVRFAADIVGRRRG